MFKEYDMVMKMNFDELLKTYDIDKYPYEYELLYIICQMPNGLFESDLKAISDINMNYGDWRVLFDTISQD
jgi:hypothetical protein